MKRYIPVSRVEGTASRQAHCDLPEGTYEREMSKEGFFGPAAFFHHRHPPTGWTEFDRAAAAARLRPRQAAGAAPASPWAAHEVLVNAHCRIRYWRAARAHGRASRATPTATSCCSSTRARGDLYCDFGHLAIEAGDYVVLPRGTLWRIECAGAARRAADRGHQLELPAAGQGPGRQPRDLRSGDARHAADRRRVPRAAGATTARGRCEVKRRNALSLITYPFNPLDAVGWHGDLSVVRINVRDIRPLMSHRYHLPPSAHTTFVAQPLRRLHLRAAAVRDRPGRAQGAVLPQQRRLRRGASSTTRATSSAATTSTPA